MFLSGVFLGSRENMSGTGLSNHKIFSEVAFFKKSNVNRIFFFYGVLLWKRIRKRCLVNVKLSKG